MGVKDYDLNPDNNTQINGINIAEGCPPSGINNAVRQLMADVKADKVAQDTATATAQSAADAAQSAADSNVKTVNGNAPDAAGNVVLDTAPVGSVIAFAANSAPSGYLLCNGAAVSRTTYANLFAAIGTTYGKGDGSKTFNLPNLTDRFIQGSGKAGTVKAAGLPDIVGDADVTFSGTNVGGAFYLNGVLDNWNGTSQGGNRNYLDFDASRSNSIYGNSDTVQPPALTMRYYIKY